MDIAREKTSSNKLTRPLIGMVIFASISITVLLGFRSIGDGHLVDRDNILIDTVKRGELNVTVRGIGVLVSKEVRWVATDIEGKVDVIHIKAGALVRKGELLLELRNPRIVRQLEEHQWQLEEMQAQIVADKLILESQLFDQEAAVINERLNHERAMLSLNAQRSLLEKDVGAVSMIDHEEIKIDVAQYKQRWSLELKRLEKAKAAMEASFAAAEARLKRMQRIVQRIQEQVDGLQVKASMDSIVQEMPLEPGQQVTAGTNLARLAKKGTFIAELRIPEKLVTDVIIGQSVIIDTRSNQIPGKVQRIDPGVINGSVQVDVLLTEIAPPEARPDLSVEGVINIAKLDDTLFVKRPMFAKQGAQTQVFKLENEQETAHRTPVTFGRISTRFIEVKEGLNAGDSIVVSDISDWETIQTIRIK